MIRVKLPMGGITPEQMEAFADVIEQYAPLNKGHITTRQNIQIHHVPLRRRGQAHPRALRRRPVQPRGLRQHRAQRHRRPVGRRRARRAVRPHPLRGRLRALLRAPPDDAADAAQGQDGLRRPRPSDRSLTGIHDIAFIARERDGRARRRGARRRRHVDHAARRADALRLRRARRRRVPQGRRGRLPHLRPPGVAARQPRPRPHQGARRQDRHRRAAQAGRGGAARATGSPSATSTSRACASTSTRRERAPAVAADLRLAQRRRLASSSASARPTSRAQRQEGFVDRRGQGHRAATSRPSSSAAWPTSRAATPAATCARPCTRTCCCAGCATRRVYEVWQALRELGLGDAGADEINDVVSCPGTDSCKLGIT